MNSQAPGLPLVGILALVLVLSAGFTLLFQPPVYGGAEAEFVSFVEVGSPDAAWTPAPTPAVLIGAGDISVCGQSGQIRTAALIDRLLAQFPQAVVFTAGDNAQSMGEMYEYTECFDRTWGRFMDRLYPSPGNHDWYFDQGANYLAYFAASPAGPGPGYYSYDLGAWHIVSLNSNCDVTGCGEDSLQAHWLRADLQRNAKACTLLYWHHPLWSSGIVPIDRAGETFWRIASEAGADVVVHGHDHHYERFAPLDRHGFVDYAAGTRLFIVGTGGAWLFDLTEPLDFTEALDNTTLGVIVFFLYPDRYDWMFAPVDGGYYTDFGSGDCS